MTACRRFPRAVDRPCTTPLSTSLPAITRTCARARVALPSAGQRSVEVRLGTRISDARRRRGRGRSDAASRWTD